MRLSRLPRRRRGPLACASPRRHERGGPRLLCQPLTRGIAVLALALALPGGAGATDVAGGTHADGRARVNGLRVELSGELLSVEAQDVVLQELLEEIARQSGLTISFHESLTRRVTTKFEALELPAAIDRLLHGASYALQYAPGEPGASARRLWLFTSGEWEASVGAETSPTQRSNPLDDAAAARLEAVAALAEADTDPFAFALASAVADESPAVRFEAVHALGEIGGEISTRLLQHALLDADADVRTAAVDALAEAGGEQSVTALAGVMTDPDPALRENAVYALGEIGGETAIDVLRQASTDADELVREAAADVLRELDEDQP